MQILHVCGDLNSIDVNPRPVPDPVPGIHCCCPANGLQAEIGVPCFGASADLGRQILTMLSAPSMPPKFAPLGPPTLVTKNVTLGYSDGNGCACTSPLRKGVSAASAQATIASFMDLSPMDADRPVADLFHDRGASITPQGRALNLAFKCL
jgi:hypothetical protein